VKVLTILDDHVAHERVEDEVVVINLETGAYYALDNASADCWTLLAGQTSVERTADVLAERFGVPHPVVRAEFDALAAELVREGLAAWDSDGVAPVEPLAPLPPAAPGGVVPEYRALRIEKYDDMEELLLLDPIHEVDDAGWPALPSESA
jgi:hypothetical protein